MEKKIQVWELNKTDSLDKIISETSLSQSLSVKFSQEDRIKIKIKIVELGDSKNNSFPIETINQFLADFENSGLSVKEILTAIESCKYNSEIYGKVKFSDIINSEGIFPVSLMTEKIKDFIKSSQENLNEISRQYYGTQFITPEQNKKILELLNANKISPYELAEHKQRAKVYEEIFARCEAIKDKRYLLMSAKKDLINDYKKIFQEAVDKLKDEPAEVKQRLKEIAIEGCVQRYLNKIIGGEK